MDDKAGRQIRAGDRVAWCWRHGSAMGLRLGTVIEVKTPQPRHDYQKPVERVYIRPEKNVYGWDDDDGKTPHVASLTHGEHIVVLGV
jgi:hypothetical protein